MTSSLKKLRLLKALRLVRNTASVNWIFRWKLSSLSLPFQRRTTSTWWWGLYQDGLINPLINNHQSLPIYLPGVNPNDASVSLKLLILLLGLCYLNRNRVLDIFWGSITSAASDVGYDLSWHFLALKGFQWDFRENADLKKGMYISPDGIPSAPSSLLFITRYLVRRV